MRTLRTFGAPWFALAGLMVALVLTSGCRRKHRYDGTCKEDAHCLDFQKCHEGVCVRREPIIKEQPKPVARPVPPSRQRLQQEWVPPQAPAEDQIKTPGNKRQDQPRYRFSPHRTKPKGRARSLFRIDA